MSAKVFLDTNFLVYMYDRDEADKRATAIMLLKSLAPEWQPVLSTQVLQELYVVLTRKLARCLPQEQATEAIVRWSKLQVVHIDVPLILAATATSQKHRLSFWDSLIFHSAAKAGCTRLLSEDLQHGFELSGVTVENPFK
jgi:predicted nucleic acid-binding protein